MKLLMSLSGKGGVGKSLIAGNIAYALADSGRNVALLDVDYSNPNLAELLGVEEEILLSPDTQQFQPILLDNDIEFFSMAGICKDRPVSMEGSMYSQILRDILSQKWNSEYAVLDMPAGIADQFLEVVNVFAEDLLGSIVVFQPAHVESARRVLRLHRNEGVPVIGLVENMAYFRCPNCGEIHHIFGRASLNNLSEEFQVTPLGTVPLSMDIRNSIANGEITIPRYVNCPVCTQLVKSQGRHGHFKSAHPELNYDQLRNDFKPGAIEHAVQLILEAKSLGMSFAQRIKEKLKGFTREVIVEVFANIVRIANTELNLAKIRKRHAFPGERTVEVNITDERLRRVKVQIFFRLEDGAWKVVRNPKEIHDEVRVWDRAFVWAILGYRTDTGVDYDLMDAWLSGKAKYYSLQAGTQRAVRVLSDVWSEVGDAPGFEKMRPLLEKVA